VFKEILMADKISVYAHKGGHGKTSIAVAYARFSGSHYLTNDYRGGAERLFKDVLGEGKFHVIQESDLEIPVFAKSIFDFGGYYDFKTARVLEAADLVVVPLSYQSRLDLEAFYNTVGSVREVTDKILVVINNTARKFLDSGLISGVQDGVGKNVPVKLIRQSAFMTYLVNEGQSPLDMEMPGALKKPLQTFQDNLRDVFTFIRDF
jgi:cellulose biosynthesis protein BcsQ